MRAALFLCVLAFASACDFDAALEAYCAGNPRCPTDAGGGGGGGGAGDGGADGGAGGGGGGSPTAQDVHFAISSAVPTSLAGQQVSLFVEARLVDGGALPGGALITADGGRASQVISSDGGAGPWSSEEELLLAPRRSLNPSMYEMFDTTVSATLTLPGGTQVHAAPLAHTVRARLSLQGASAGQIGSPYSPFTCVPLTIEVGGANNNDFVALDAGVLAIQVVRIDGGSPVAVFPNDKCQDQPVLTLTNPAGLPRYFASLRTAEHEAFSAALTRAEDEQYFDAPLLPYRLAPLPLEPVLTLERAETFYARDGGTQLSLPDGGAFTCVHVQVSWRVASGIFAGQKLTPTQAGDEFPVRLSGYFEVSLSAGCTSSTTLRTHWYDPSTGDFEFWLKDIDNMPNQPLVVSLPDGGAAATFFVP